MVVVVWTDEWDERDKCELDEQATINDVCVNARALSRVRNDE
jgi:hypothetical protein